MIRSIIIYNILYMHEMQSFACQPKLERPTSLDAGDKGGHEVARVDRPTTAYKLVVRVWENSV